MGQKAAPASEAQIESYHARFSRIMNDHNSNLGWDLCRRIVRTLADSAVVAAQMSSAFCSGQN